MDQNFELVAILLRNAWYFMILGALLAMVIEHESVWNLYEQVGKPKAKLWDTMHPLLIRLSYNAVGILIVSGSYTVVNLLFDWFQPSKVSLISGGGISEAFLISFALMIMSGYALSLSAGTRWLVFLSKLLATLSVVTAIGYMVLTHLFV